MFGIKLEKERSRIIVAGCGRLGASIASMLSVKGSEVVLIDSNTQAFRKVSSDFSGFTVGADATDIDVLTDLGIDRAGMMVAVTSDDNVNIMIAQIAKVIFDVPLVIMRLYDTEKAVLSEDAGIQTISPYTLSMDAFERLCMTGDKKD